MHNTFLPLAAPRPLPAPQTFKEPQVKDGCHSATSCVHSTPPSLTQPLQGVDSVRSTCTVDRTSSMSLGGFSTLRPSMAAPLLSTWHGRQALSVRRPTVHGNGVP
ncbi:hypothetical protein Cob_v000637 [Colletotrichum orbiculare MAFF 240422]|uniref:Uncharacterized protein n=1 Tax=Colletotrichum orbiculare (strain 104-T / ATCC 96160 / CBS 514.97 / LARS 414 / MAFF 240422) TaxID=1213857 RepID=A0A484G6L4_COLOR|nr:hypothetical protein Cob_v000637 [Colletotrichum orbiculare MAFF 240422]